MRFKNWRRMLTVVLTVALVFGSINVPGFVSKAVENAYEATSGTHGASYDASTDQVTFWVKDTDAFYAQVNHMWYKEYATYEEAAQAHVMNGGNFIAGVGATALTANSEGTEKSVTVDVADGTGAILYYINGEAGHARPDFEHIIVIDANAGGNEEGSETPDEGDDTDVPIMTGDPHGATYDETSKQITFFVNNNDTFYNQVEFLWYKEYATVAEAEAAHISNGGNFIEGVGATNMTANAEGTQKAVTVPVADTTAAIVYYINAGAGHARPDYEHVVVIKADSSDNGDNTQGGGSPDAGEGEDGGEDDVIPAGCIDLEAKTAVENGILTWVAGDASDATISYAGASMTVNATTWGQQDWWSIQWAVQDLDVTAGNWVVEYDIVSTINKPVLSKLTNFGSGDQDTPIVESTYDLTANESKHVTMDATIAADGKVRLFFNLAGGNGAGSVTISNVKLTAGTATETPDEGGNEGGNEGGETPGAGDEGEEPTPSAYINLEEKTAVENGILTWVAGDASDATFSYAGESVTVNATTWGQQDWWSIQWAVQDLDVTAGNWVVEYDIVSTINKPVLSKLTNFGSGDQDTPIVESTYDLTANESKHVTMDATIAADGKVRLFFNLAGGNGAGSVTISNVKLTVGTATETPDEGGNEGGETPGAGEEGGDDVVANAIVFDNVETSFYRSQDDGGWAGDANATISYDGTKAVVSADSFGWNAWGIQWKLLGLTSAEETNTFAFDVVSSINKSINVKIETTNEMETINLVAGETYHYEKEIASASIDVTMDLVYGEGAGTLTFSNMVYGTAGAVEEESNAIVFDNVETSFYRSQDDGGWAGDANATISYDGTKAVVSADSFGWNAWGIQWKLLGLTSEEDTNTFAFDVVSSINKTINVKIETTAEMETITLVAGETYHYEKEIASNKIDVTMDLVYGEGAGTLTFSNMVFGTGSSSEGGNEGGNEGGSDVETPDNNLVANSEALVFEDLTIETYLSQNDGGWAGDSNVAFNYNGTTAQITADNFGWNAWGIQWKLLNLTSSVEDNVFEFDVVSSLDKNIVVKNEETGVAETVALKAGQTYHYAIAVSGKTLNATFDLTGGAAAGTLTFTNMKFGPAGVIEAAPSLTSAKAMDKANGFKVGQNVVLNYDAAATAWAAAISEVKVNNQAVDAAKYTAADGALTIDASVFTRENVYKVEVAATGFGGVEITLPVYDADVASENWSVAWEDQFNGTELDTTKWSYEIGIQSGEDGASASPTYWGNNEKQYYTKEAVEVKDGYLVITGDKLTQDVKNQYNVTDTTVQYTSGRIRTVTDSGEVLAATTYGRVEALMSLPEAAGYWPAFWMLPTPETCELYGTWASSGELDIMEAVGQNGGQTNGTIHYGGNWPNNVHTGGTYVFPDGESIAGEHLYAVEWEPGEIRWYVDDVLFYVANNWYGMDANGEKYSYPAPFDEDFYILFNLAMSGNYVANVMPTEMGKAMKVDYVRILTDANTDYEAEVTAPKADRDTAFFEANGGYVDLIQDKDYTTLASHAYGDGANVIPGIGYWSSAVNTGAGADATVEVIDGVAKVDVTKLGSNDYNIQLIQNIPLAKGYTYRITFDAWTDLGAGRGFTVAPKGDADNGWAAYDAGINAVLSTESKTFTYEFLMTADSDPTARLEMNIGGAKGSVYVDNVSVIALTDAELEGSDEVVANAPMTSGEHIYNGAFDKGAGKLGNWRTEGAAGSAADRSYTVTVGNEGAKLIQTGIQLLEQDTYKLTFDASTLSAGKVVVTMMDNDGEPVYATEEYALTTQTGAYELEFTVPAGKGTDLGKLVFDFVGEGETFTVDNVSMFRLTNVHMNWDAYEMYPMGEGDDAMNGFTVYDEVWTWATNPATLSSIDGENVLVQNTTPASESWKVLLQKENVAIAKGMTYRIQYAIKASVDDQAVEVKIEDTNYSPCYLANLTVGTEWTYVDTTFTSSLAGAGALKFCLAGVDQDCTIYVKDVCIVLDGVPTPQFAAGAEVTEMEIGTSCELDIVYSTAVQEKYMAFTYESSDESVVEVAEDGTMTAKAMGNATITVTSVLGTKFTFDVAVVEEVEEPAEPEVEIVVGDGAPAIQIPAEDLLDAVGAEGDVTVKVEINTIEEPTKKEENAVKKALKELKNAVVGAYFDIDVFKVVDDVAEAVTNLDAPIRFTIEIPEGLRAENRTFVMVRIHNGEASVLADLDTDATTITFETDRFSTYVLVYEEEETTPEIPEGPGKDEEKPSKPEKPEKPEKPGKDEEKPSKPEKPEKDEKPAKPEKPGKEEQKPSKPSTPAKPATPVAPVAPVVRPNAVATTTSTAAETLVEAVIEPIVEVIVEEEAEEEAVVEEVVVEDTVVDDEVVVEEVVLEEEAEEVVKVVETEEIAEEEAPLAPQVQKTSSWWIFACVGVAVAALAVIFVARKKDLEA